MTVLDLPRRQHVSRPSFKAELIGRERFAAEWPSITAGSNTRMYVYQSREFLKIWMDTIGCANGIEPCLIVVRDGEEQPVLYLPLAIETRLNVRFLRFMDFGVVDYNAPVLCGDREIPPREFRSLWNEILALLPPFDVIDLKKIAGDVAGVRNPLIDLDCVPHPESGHALLLAPPSSSAGPVIPSLSFKQKLRRELRKLGETHDVEFVVNPEGATRLAFTERLFELKRHKYQQTNVADFLSSPGVSEFYRRIADPQPGKIGHLSALVVDGAPVSLHLGFIDRDRFYYIMPAYDAAYGKHRPGHLLLNFLVDEASKAGIETFDLGVGDEAYKISWASERIALYDHQEATTKAGQLFLQLRRVRRFLKSEGVRNWFRPAG